MSELGPRQCVGRATPPPTRSAEIHPSDRVDRGNLCQDEAMGTKVRLEHNSSEVTGEIKGCVI